MPACTSTTSSRWSRRPTRSVGFLLFTLGSLALMVALWRSCAEPWWLPIGYLVLTVGTFALGGVALDIVQAIQMLSLV